MSIANLLKQMPFSLGQTKLKQSKLDEVYPFANKVNLFSLSH